jgi:hypothetical protein
MFQSCRENENKNFVSYFFPKIIAVYGIMWQNVVQPGRPQMTALKGCSLDAI